MLRSIKLPLIFAVCCALFALNIPYRPAQAVEGAKFEESECLVEIPTGYNVTCGYLTVLENRTNKSEKTIRLHVAIFRADKPTKTPIVYLEGGPGGSGVMSIDGWADSPLLKDRDFVLLDQRGTGYSEPSLNCPEYQEQQSVIEAISACRDRLATEGVDLAAYNSAENAVDVAELRLALGYKEWTLLGISYGTRLALTVMRDRPEGVRSVILDGVYPPHVNMIENLGPNTVAVFQHLFDRCEADPACGRAYPDLADAFYKLLDSLRQSPAEISYTDPADGTTVDVTIDDGRFVDILFNALYSPDYLPVLPKLIYQGKDNDFAALSDLLAEGVRYRRQSVEGDDDSEGMFLSVECHEEVPFNSIVRVQARLENAPEALRDKLLTDAQSYFAECIEWGVPKAAIIENEPVKSSIPALILNGEFDPITPAAYGAEAAKYLTNDFAFDFPAVGHSAVGTSPCADQIVLDFLAKPESRPDSGCIQTLGKIDFVVK